MSTKDTCRRRLGRVAAPRRTEAEEVLQTMECRAHERVTCALNMTPESQRRQPTTPTPTLHVPAGDEVGGSAGTDGA